jgi:hypothetical protein
MTVVPGQKLSAWHRSQAWPLTPKNPASHRHSVPAALAVFCVLLCSGHAWQALAPVAFWNVCCAHAAQTVGTAPGAPTVAPLSASIWSSAGCASAPPCVPSRAWKYPAGHGAHPE